MIYFAKNEFGDIKIGFSCNPKKRLTSLKKEYRCDIVILAYINGSREDESLLHNRFSHLRFKGEWFHASHDLLSYISSLKNELCDEQAIIDRAIIAGGGQANLAKKLGVSRQAINQWKRIPDLKILDVERHTGISRHELRPDIFGRE